MDDVVDEEDVDEVSVDDEDDEDGDEVEDDDSIDVADAVFSGFDSDDFGDSVDLDDSDAPDDFDWCVEVGSIRKAIAYPIHNMKQAARCLSRACRSDRSRFRVIFVAITNA
ncbi:hypothetical protein KEM55_002201 [Ascosphaera atra]|nr:hypothetical protein KEM55_002201 [Ascosphaera atra]